MRKEQRQEWSDHSKPRELLRVLSNFCALTRRKYSKRVGVFWPIRLAEGDQRILQALGVELHIRQECLVPTVISFQTKPCLYGLASFPILGCRIIGHQPV